MRNKSFDEEEIGGEYALIRYREGRGSLYSDHRGPGEILLRKLTVPYIHIYIYLFHDLLLARPPYSRTYMLFIRLVKPNNIVK